MLSRDCLRFLLDHERDVAEGIAAYGHPADEALCKALLGRVERAFAPRAVTLGREQRAAHSLPESRFVPAALRARIEREVGATYARSFAGGVDVVVRWSAFGPLRAPRHPPARIRRGTFQLRRCRPRAFCAERT